MKKEKLFYTPDIAAVMLL